MKKAFVFMCAIGFVCLLTAPLYAGGIVNKQNQSADYMRTLNRSAATDYPDIIVFNPAGIMQMEDGAYAKVDVMYFAKDYSNTPSDDSFYPPFNQHYGKLSQDEPSIIPGAFTLFKKKKWAGFFSFTIPAGGGGLDYKDGNARTGQLAQGVAIPVNLAATGGATFLAPYNVISDMSIKVTESSVYGYTLGASFALNEMWSFAVGARYATGTREFEGKVTLSGAGAPDLPLKLKLHEEANGWAGILGINFKPTDKLNTALTYVSNTRLNYQMDVQKDTNLNGQSLAATIGYPDGSKRRIDIPGLLGFGISYQFLPQLNVALNYVYYLESGSNISTFEGYDYGNSWDLGLTAEYTFNPQWKASIGYLYTDISFEDDAQILEPEEPKLDANTVGAGLVYSPTPAWAVTVGGAYVAYEDVTDSYGIKYEKTVWNVSLGVTWKFM